MLIKSTATLPWLVFSASLMLLMLGAPSALGENLGPEDYSGVWASDPAGQHGEFSTLRITDNNSATFTRTALDKRYVIRASSCQFDLVGDLLIIQFSENEHKISQKLVLNGHKTGSKKSLFGILYLYRDGILFNGLSVLFGIGWDNLDWKIKN